MISLIKATSALTARRLYGEVAAAPAKPMESRGVVPAPWRSHIRRYRQRRVCGAEKDKRRVTGVRRAAMPHLPANRPPSHDACIATGNLGLRLEPFSLAPTHGIAQPAACRGATAAWRQRSPDVSLRSRFDAVHFSPAVSVQRVSSCPRARQSVASVRGGATNFFPGAHKAPLNHAIAARHGGMMLL